jgi:hypothetical protein
MVKMKSGSDLEAQQVSRLNEYFLVVDRIQEVGRSSRQGNGKLQSKLLNLSDDVTTSALPLSINLGGFARTNRSVGSLV